MHKYKHTVPLSPPARRPCGQLPIVSHLDEATVPRNTTSKQQFLVFNVPSTA